LEQIKAASPEWLRQTKAGMTLASIPAAGRKFPTSLLDGLIAPPGWPRNWRARVVGAVRSFLLTPP
jgi:hypothetical protein